MASAEGKRVAPHVLIVGAGITGLLIAQGLKKSNVSFEIFEQDESPAVRTRDWGMGIHWSLPLLSKCLPAELLDRIQAAQVDSFFVPLAQDVVPIMHGETGEILKEIPIPRFHRVSRTKFRTLCSSDISITYGKKLDRMEFTESGVTIFFADGSTASGTTAIGADGARSATRHLILGDAAKLSIAPYVATSVAVKYDDAQKAIATRSVHKINAMAVHPAGIWSWISILDVENESDPTSWTFQLMSSWPGEGKPTLEDLQEKTSVLATPFGNANRWIPAGTPVNINNVSYWQPVQWDNHGGKVTLAGDAAHPMTFHRGQGLNHAVADAAKFVEAVASGENDAITNYDKEVIARAGEEVRVSKLNTDMVHDWNRLMESPLMKISANRST